MVKWTRPLSIYRGGLNGFPQIGHFHNRGSLTNNFIFDKVIIFVPRLS